MPYVIDRERALCLADIVAVVGIRRRGHRSRVVLRDNSLYHTLTRPRTLVRYAREEHAFGARAHVTYIRKERHGGDSQEGF